MISFSGTKGPGKSFHRCGQWLLPVAAALLVLAGCQARGTGTTLTGAASAAPLDAEAVADLPFGDWLATFRAEAAAQGVSARTLDAALGPARPIDKVLELDQSQPEFTRAIWSYLDGALSDKRVVTGRDRLVQHGPLLNGIETRYGVPPEILVAFWGIESNFGENMGGYPVVDALATLAWHGRRAGMFRAELLAALRIIDNGDITRETMRGSWAGAMGQTQFMPTVYLRHAVDHNGDGRRDIWTNLPDVFASTARFVADIGWRKGESWGEEVTVPPDFPWELAELSIRKPVADWQRLGVRAVAGGELPGSGEASVLLPAGHAGPAFLVRDNFRAIMRYNPATSYALAVALLSDRVKGTGGAGGLAGAWPRHEQPLTRTEAIELQQRLDNLGFAVGKPDGLIGPATRTALRAFQKSTGAVPDGFATKALLERIRQVTPG